MSTEKHLNASASDDWLKKNYRSIEFYSPLNFNQNRLCRILRSADQASRAYRQAELDLRVFAAEPTFQAIFQ